MRALTNTILSFHSHLIPRAFTTALSLAPGDNDDLRVCGVCAPRDCGVGDPWYIRPETTCTARTRIWALFFSLSKPSKPLRRPSYQRLQSPGFGLSCVRSPGQPNRASTSLFERARESRESGRTTTLLLSTSNLMVTSPS